VLIKEQVKLVKKSVAVTRVKPGFSALFIVCGIVSNHSFSSLEIYFRDATGITEVMTLLLLIAALYFEAGCYFMFAKRFRPPSDNESFFTVAKRYFPSLLLISFYTFLILFFFMICLFYLVDTLAGQWIDSAKIALALASMVVALVTIYVIPILYTHGSRGMESFYHAFKFLWGNLGRSRVLFILIAAETLLWVLLVFSPPFFRLPILSIFFIFLYRFVSSYLGAVLFLTAVQLLKDEEGMRMWALA
jgi:hypothetical protein